MRVTSGWQPSLSLGLDIGENSSFVVESIRLINRKTCGKNTIERHWASSPTRVVASSVSSICSVFLPLWHRGTLETLSMSPAYQQKHWILWHCVSKQPELVCSASFTNWSPTGLPAAHMSRQGWDNNVWPGERRRHSCSGPEYSCREDLAFLLTFSATTRSDPPFFAKQNSEIYCKQNYVIWFLWPWSRGVP
jgi:hypothetical protein